MRFERLESGDFTVNGTLVKKNIFLTLEPNYSEPLDTIHFRYDQGVGRTVTTRTKQYKIAGVWEEGERYFRRLHDLKRANTLTENQETEEECEPEAKPASYRQARKNEYPPLSDLIVALWENLIEKKTKKESGVDSIQKLRKEVKSKYSLENKKNAISQDETETN